jgi:hypothetical protein
MYKSKPVLMVIWLKSSFVVLFSVSTFSFPLTLLNIFALQELKIVAKNNTDKNVLIDVFIMVDFSLRFKDLLIDV